VLSSGEFLLATHPFRGAPSVERAMSSKQCAVALSVLLRRSPDVQADISSTFRCGPSPWS